MIRKLYIAVVLSIATLTASGQSVFTTFILGFTTSSGTYRCSPRTVLVMPDSTYRLFCSHKINVQSDYKNGIVAVSKNGSIESGDLLNAGQCYFGDGFSQCRKQNRSYFLYANFTDYCQPLSRISKVDENGSSMWQKEYSEPLGYPEALNGDSFAIIRGSNWVIYNSSGDSVGVKVGKIYTQIKQAQTDYYTARDSEGWVFLDKSLQEVWRKSDSITGIKGTVVSYERLHNGKYAVLSKGNCVYDAVLLGSWCNYTITILNSLFQFESSDSVSNSINSQGSALVTELDDGGLLLITPQGRYDLKVTKMFNGSVQYSHTINTFSTNKSFAIYGSEFHAIEVVTTLDKGKLLLIEKENGPYDRSTMLMKFDSIGNFYWPFATGREELSNILHSVYPNPVTEKLYFELNEPGQHTLTVTDASGQVIYQNTAKDKAEIETAQWSNGVYFYHLNSGSKTSTGKFVKM